jgi:hypothetical protein
MSHAVIKDMSDGQVVAEYEDLNRRIGAALSRREDLIDALQARELGDVRKLHGLKTVAEAVAKKLDYEHLTLPDIAPVRPRDETSFWVNLSSLAALVKMFLDSEALRNWDRH